MQDKELSELIGLPVQTMAQWKKTPPTDWRLKIYTYFKLKDISELKPEIERVEKILEAKAKENKGE